VGWDDIQYADRLMSTYTTMLTSDSLRAELARRLGIATPLQIDVNIPANTELMRISVEAPSRISATKAANDLAEILINRVSEQNTPAGRSAQQILSEQLAQIDGELSQARRHLESVVGRYPEGAEQVTSARRSVVLKENTYATILEQYEGTRISDALRANTVSVLEPAVAAQAVTKPNYSRDIVVALIVGLAGGIGLAFLYEHLDSTLYTAQEIEAATDKTALAAIPTAKNRAQIGIFNGNSPQEEAFRRLRTNLFALDHRPLHQTLLVTSAEPGEGKSTIAANLAAATAKSGRKVIVIDADLRRPTLDKIFHLPNDRGLSNVLMQHVTFDKAIQSTEIPGLHVLTSGPLPPNPVELLGSQEMSILLKYLTKWFDLVLLDSPALLPVADAAVLAPSVDGVALVVGLAHVRREAVQAAYRQLAKLNPGSLDVIVNRAAQNGSYLYYQPAPPGR
jgi:non-specific protein-tyrosine kinase